MLLAVRGIKPTTFLSLVFFEAGAGLFGLLLIRLVEGAWRVVWVVDETSVRAAVFYTIPALLFAFVVTSSRGLRWGPLKRIFEIIEKSFLGSFIREASLAQLALVSLAAGVGEEILFRGAFQGWWGLTIASIIFGLLHALTPTYFIVAMLMGFYLGSLYESVGQNLFVPAFVHGVYDFVALLLYKRQIRHRELSQQPLPRFDELLP